MNVLWRIRRLFRGLGHSRGFGIQSPWAYGLVTEVLCQRQSFYAYDELQQAYPDVKGRRLRLCRLYLRLSNYRQEQPWTIVLESDASRKLVERYLQVGCHKSHVSLTTTWPQNIDDYAESDMLVVEGISSSRSQREKWLQLLSNPHVIVSFDLLDCGVCFFDPAKNRHCYVINP